MTAGERKTLLTGLAFISPWILGFLIFTVYPVVASFVLAFCDYDVLSPPAFVGLANFQDMGNDVVFTKSLVNTFVFAAMALPLGLAMALALAMLLNQPVKGRSIFRAIFFLPSLVPFVASAMIWIWILNGQFGLLNQALEAIGISKPPQWLADPNWTKPSIVMMSLWGLGNTVVIFLASLQEVPRHLYEAAEIDGAGAWVKFRHITLPMISPVIYFNLMVGIIGALQIFGPAYVMFGNGGPDRSAMFYALYLFQNAFEYRQMGYACAMAWVLFVIILFLTWAAHRSTRNKVHYTGG